MIDIIMSDSRDIPYEDTNYNATIQIVSNGTPSSEGTQVIVTTSSIKCSKVSIKKYGDSTYYKVEIPSGIVISSDEPVLLIVEKEDDYQLRINEKITNNIVAAETSKYKWFRWQVTQPGTIGHIVMPSTWSQSIPGLDSFRYIGERTTTIPTFGERTTTIPTLGYASTMISGMISTSDLVSYTNTMSINGDMDGDYIINPGLSTYIQGEDDGKN